MTEEQKKARYSSGVLFDPVIDAPAMALLFDDWAKNNPERLKRFIANGLEKSGFMNHLPTFLSVLSMTGMTGGENVALSAILTWLMYEQDGTKMMEAFIEFDKDPAYRQKILDKKDALGKMFESCVAESKAAGRGAI